MKMNKEERAEQEEYATRGPFTSIFGGPVARLFDQVLIVGNMEQSIAILADSTNLSYKTTKKALEKLRKMGLVIPTRKIGNAQAYKFLVENEMHELLSCGEKFQRARRDI
jgi:DNA-binding GntR family transcriptional regulator